MCARSLTGHFSEQGGTSQVHERETNGSNVMGERLPIELSVIRHAAVTPTKGNDGTALAQDSAASQSRRVPNSSALRLRATKELCLLYMYPILVRSFVCTVVQSGYT